MRTNCFDVNACVVCEWMPSPPPRVKLMRRNKWRSRREEEMKRKKTVISASCRVFFCTVPWSIIHMWISCFTYIYISMVIDVVGAYRRKISREKRREGKKTIRNTHMNVGTQNQTHDSNVGEVMECSTHNHRDLVPQPNRNGCSVYVSCMQEYWACASYAPRLLGQHQMKIFWSRTWFTLGVQRIKIIPLMHFHSLFMPFGDDAFNFAQFFWKTFQFLTAIPPKCWPYDKFHCFIYIYIWLVRVW